MKKFTIKNFFLNKKKFSITTELIISNTFLKNLEINKNILYIKNRNINNFLDKSIKRKFGKIIKKIIVKPPGEPSSNMINKYLNKSYISKVDQILVVGGGSAIDFAKGISVIKPKNRIEYHEFKNRIKKCLPIISIPTTCGTGSDISPYCVINNSDTKRKFTIKDEKFIPIKTYIYPSILSSIDRKFIFSSLFDAFSHCLEVFLNKNQKFELKKLAFAGIKLGVRLLEEKISKKNYIKYMLLSFYGGICLAKSRTSIIHTCSVAYAKYINLPHGLLNLFLTANGINFNSKFIKKEISLIERHLKEKNLYKWLEKIEKNNKQYMNYSSKKIKSNKILQRIKQDKTLKLVCHTITSDKNLKNLIMEINEKIKKKI